jgi:DNA-binding CsgD family transcriptional regulator
MPKQRSRSKPDKYGARIELIDRRREAWSMRVSGCSYAQIAKTLGVGIATAHKDCQIAEEQFGEIALQPEVVREGLMALHGKLNGALLSTLYARWKMGRLCLS